MCFDEERILAKAAFIREQVKAIQDLIADRSKEAIIYDQWVLKGLKYSLQIAIEAMIDMGYHISAKQFAHAPVDARDAFRVLLTNQIIGQEEFELYSSMIGFRNRIVHGYQEVSPERVYEVAIEEIEDFNRFINSILKLLSKKS